jgi:hypothetical protein
MWLSVGDGHSSVPIWTMSIVWCSHSAPLLVAGVRSSHPGCMLRPASTTTDDGDSAPSWRPALTVAFVRCRGAHMDDRRFDNLARFLAAGTASRRVTARLLAGGALAAVFGRTAVEEAAAAVCKQGSRRCTRNSECCSRTCRNRGTCRPCASAGICMGSSPCGLRGECVCYPSWEGPATCFANGFLNCDRGGCQGSEECDAGWACAVTCICTLGTVCMPLCGTLPNP